MGTSYYCCCEKKEEDPTYNNTFIQPPRQQLYQSGVIDQQPGPNSHERNERKRGPAESTNSFNEEEQRSKRKKPQDNNFENKKKPQPTPEDRTLTDFENTFIDNLNQIQTQATPFFKEIEKFTELEDSNKYYYIEESLRRLIEKLDNMHDDLQNNKFLRDQRKEVYKYIFPLFDKLDEKVQRNKDIVANINTSRK